MTGAALVVLPAGICWLLAAVVALLDGRRPWVGWLAVAGLGASLAATIALTLRTLNEEAVQTVGGGWPADVGIALRADALGATFAAVSLGVVLVSLVHEVLVGVRSRTFPALVLFLSAGLSGLFVTGDVFSFYVFFEISMTAAYVLVGYREQDYQVRAAFIFAVVNLLGSVLFLIGAAALYHVTGSLNMEVVANRVEAVNPASSIAVATAIFVAFFLKLGLFPFHFWLPAVYVGSHAPVAAILSGALANIGSYGVLRFGAGIFPESLRFAAVVIMALGVGSIIYGALQAVSRHETSEVMAYSAIGQVGYILVALAIGGPVGYAAAVIYAVANSMNKALVFLSAGLRGALAGAAFAVGAFSIAGVPPAVGFVGKLALFKASIESSPGGLAGSVALVVLVFLGGAISFLYSFQVYQRAFIAPSRKRQGKPSPRSARWWAILLTAVVLAAGLWPEPLIIVGEGAADALMRDAAGDAAVGGGG